MTTMAAADVRRVLQLKLRLKESTEAKTVLKTLKKLEELDITLDILAETGIGKLVNSFRKHDGAGDVAKTLVTRWKKLVPKDGSSGSHGSPKEQSKAEDEQGRTNDNCQVPEKKKIVNNCERSDSNMEIKISKKLENVSKSPCKRKPKGSVEKDKSKAKKDADTSHSPLKLCSPSETTDDPPAVNQKFDIEKTVSGITSNHGPKNVAKFKPGCVEKKEKQVDVNQMLCDKLDKEPKRAKGKLSKPEVSKHCDDTEKPSMSFEACLSYDLEGPKRKKRTSDGKKAKKHKTDHKWRLEVQELSLKSSKTLAVAKSSVLELLNIPLPTTLPECGELSQFNYFERKAGEKIADVSEEAPVFTGQRLNKKMLVYSGTKISYLPSMMTLHQQCIRVLQNNIDSLYEIGGVPFEILEPVLERCTPEQLLRIEECNPVYIGVTDHLWERHCHRDFRGAQLEEYESWREMHLRLSEERERKLRSLTKSISSAHSGKPKGRQVKFIHSAAKPPRNVRLQQEVNGMAGSVPQPHSLDKLSVKATDSGGRSCPNPLARPVSSGTNPCPAQDSRKAKRMAPIMAKSLKAFKNQIGRR